MDDPQFMRSLSDAVETGREMDWLYSTFSYNTMVPLNETPIINFRNYRYKIVEIFVMTYKQERAVLEVEIATPDTLTMLGTYAEYKLADKLHDLNAHIARGSHSWNKILLLAHNDVRLLVNMAFAVMHLYAADMVALSDNEIVYCYILAAAVIASIDKATQARLSRDILKRGIKRAQYSISERSSSILSMANKPPKESSRAEAAYVSLYASELNTAESLGHGRRRGGRSYKSSTSSSPSSSLSASSSFSSRSSPDFDDTSSADRKLLPPTQVDAFVAAARRLSMRKACLKSLVDARKDLPQLGRLLHLGRSGNGDGSDPTEPCQLAYYVGGDDVLAMPASSLGPHRYKKADGSRSAYKKSMW